MGLQERIYPDRKAIDMTDCTTQPLLFASVDRRQFVADFEGGDLTSDGGLPLLREVDRKIGLIDAIDQAIHDPRCPWLIEHDQRSILAQRIFAIAAGYEDLNDHQSLRDDTLLKAVTDRRLKSRQSEEDPLSSPPTLCRLENRVKAQAGTIRLKVLKIGGRIVRSVRRLVVHLASGFPMKRTFETIVRRLREWRCIPIPAP